MSVKQSKSGGTHGSTSSEPLTATEIQAYQAAKQTRTWRRNRYIDWLISEGIVKPPYPRQQAFLSLPHREAFFGGAAGGGKSVSLLIADLSFDGPDAAILLDDAKIGILAASVLAGALGYALLRTFERAPSREATAGD